MRITLTKKRAAIKLESAIKAVYYFQRFEGTRYRNPVPIAQMVEAFVSDPRARLKIDVETSKHTLTLVDQKNLQVGYDVEFS
ncbi:MAG: hypothetical protein V4510_12395 [bacterium]